MQGTVANRRLGRSPGRALGPIPGPVYGDVDDSLACPIQGSHLAQHISVSRKRAHVISERSLPLDVSAAMAFEPFHYVLEGGAKIRHPAARSVRQIECAEMLLERALNHHLINSRLLQIEP